MTIDTTYGTWGLSHKAGLLNYTVNCTELNPDPLMSCTEVKRNDPHFTKYKLFKLSNFTSPDLRDKPHF